MVFPAEDYRPDLVHDSLCRAAAGDFLDRSQAGISCPSSPSYGSRRRARCAMARKLTMMAHAFPNPNACPCLHRACAFPCGRRSWQAVQRPLARSMISCDASLAPLPQNPSAWPHFVATAHAPLPALRPAARDVAKVLTASTSSMNCGQSPNCVRGRQAKR